MKGYKIFPVSIGFILCFYSAALAQMGSANYYSPSAVHSAGGAPMASANYETNSTLGQPSALEPAGAVQSVPSGKSNYPGFWPTRWGPNRCPDVTDLASQAKDAKIQLTWTHVGADEYYIYRKTDGQRGFEWVAGTTSTYATWLDTNVVNGTTYYYKVTGVCEGYQSIYSNEDSATPESRRRR